MRRKIRKIWSVLLVFTLLISGTAFVSAASGREKDTKVVRVACLGFDGFIEKGSGGLYKGYAVAYLNKLSQYTGWKYEYVEGSWEEQLMWLGQGKVDLLCSAQKTTERERRYLFSEMSLGTEETVIYARPDDDSVYYRDHEHMNGKTVGMFEETFQNAQFMKHAAALGITYQTKMYQSSEAVVEALWAGEIDLAVLGSLTKRSELKVVDRFAPEPFYFMTSRKNGELMDTLNGAMNELHLDSPYIQELLSEVYYKNSSYYNHPLLTRTEADYIAGRKEPVKVGCISNLYPMAYTDSKTGKLDGIYVALLNRIEKISGLDLEIEGLTLKCEPEQLIRDGEYDVVAGVMYNQEVMANPKLQLTDSFFNQPFVWISKKGVDVYALEHPVVALSTSFRRYPSLLPEEPKEAEYVFCASPEENLEAVEDGTCDIAIMSVYVVTPFLQTTQHENLVMTTLRHTKMENSMLLSTNADRELVSILNKSIGCISENTVNEIVGHYSAGTAREITLGEFLEKYRLEILEFGLVAVILAAFLFANGKRRVALHYEQMEKEIYRHRAETDMLTGLYNKDKFYDAGVKYLSARREGECSLIFINVENFKLINDLFGIPRGDKFLCYLADELQLWTKENDAVCSRYEADHFVVLTDCTMKEIEKLVNHLSEKANAFPLDMMIEIAAGVYIIREKNHDLQIMCDRAHLASDSIKKNHQYNMAIYEDSHRQKLIQEQLIINEMEDALAGRQFCAYFQPKYNTRTDAPIGAEALVRWIHPKQGLLSPGIFIPVFEKNGFIGRLDLFVYEEVCRFLKKWKEEGLPQIPVSVNLSRVGFYNPKLVDTLCRIADEYGVPRELLELEVTETAYARDSKVIFGILQRLRAEGFRILMDDFGSGYSSLNMLKEAPIDEIKLDMRFLSAADPYDRAETILQMIIAMGNEMSMSVIAEGVETEKQKKMLESFRCYKAQGYFYAKPMSESDYEKILRSM